MIEFECSIILFLIGNTFDFNLGLSSKFIAGEVSK